MSERYIQTLEREGFTNVYEWQDAPSTSYPPRSHDSAFSLIVTDGSITIDRNGHKKEYYAGQRFDIGAEEVYSAETGELGVIYIAAEGKE